MNDPVGGRPYRTLHDVRHLGWDNALPPALHIEPGETVLFEVAEASGGQLTPSSTAEDVARLDTSRANPLTGPVYVDGAEPGDVLVIEVLDFELSGWGWTALIPGFGLLADEFPEPFLHISRYTSEHVQFAPDLRLPTRPFTGTIGVAPAEPGRHGVIPPRAVGGNLDLRDLVAGTRLYLPVRVPGALFSVGDTHAAQGDGEVCGTAVESPMEVRLRFGVEKGRHLARPRAQVPASAPVAERRAGFYVTMGIADDLRVAARDAVRDMIDYVDDTFALGPELAYCLVSVAAELKISECVNAPNWVVTAYLPDDLAGRG